MTASRIAPPNEIRFSVRFAETDMARVYHHSNTFVWFEAGRFALIEKMIGGQPMIEVDGYRSSPPSRRLVSRSRASPGSATSCGSRPSSSRRRPRSSSSITD